MTETLITVTILGLLAGFIFSMPVAGPVSIVLVSNALKGKQRFCKRLAMGASIAEFLYVFIAIYGIALLYETYQTFIPYLLIGGSIFLFFIGIKVSRAKINLNEIDAEGIVSDKILNKGGLRTGLIINFTNPSLFIGWLTSSFLLFSFASSIGLNTGGLDLIVNENVQNLSVMAGEELQSLEFESFENNPGNVVDESNSLSSILLSIVYAIAVSVGGFVWLFYFSKIIIKYRQKFKVEIVNRIIMILGYCLLLLSGYLIYQAIKMILNQ